MLWQHQFATPTGATLAMTSLGGKPLIVNFWATWCPPCVEELPMLDSFYRQHSASGWQVVGLAVDQPAAVSKFLERTPVSFPIAMAGLAGISLSRDLGNQAGGLPYTLVLDAAGRILERKMGQLSLEDFDRWARGRTAG
ncbi:MAG: TlpA disulfide reductase family protein [Burkholderiales bacterium]